MSKKSELRQQRTGTVINATSSKQETNLTTAINEVHICLQQDFPHFRFSWNSRWFLSNIITTLKSQFPQVDFANPFESSFMRPDGGILCIVDKHNNKYPVLIAEKKNQGTNDIRKKEGKVKQAKGNAIERLGKNVIGFRTALLDENIFPFVCFGDGCDFAPDSSIIDRVVTIAMFGDINKEYLHNQSIFNRGSFYFKVEEWSVEEMFTRCYSIAKSSVYYYISKYKHDSFQ